jgi:amino acid transporter
MRRNVLVYGLISGLIVSFIMLIPVTLSYKNNEMMDMSVWIGYASMLIALSMIFVGIKNYRDKYNNGVISFSRAFAIGLLIALVASTIYVLTWQIEYRLFFPEFMDKYTAHELTKLNSSGMSQQLIDQKTADMMRMKELYKNPLVNILLTYLEILPVGLVVSLICAAILKRKNKSMHTQAA